MLLLLEVLVTRLILSLLVLTAAVIAAPGRAQTYDPNYPFCMHVYGELVGERMDCAFTSLAQCRAAAAGLPATCLVNPFFARAPALRKR